MRRITINLLDEELQALISIALQERRNIREQAAILIRGELDRLGVLVDGLEQAELDLGGNMHADYD